MQSIVVTGSLAFDQIMNMPGKFADHIMADKLHVLNVSFIVDTLRKEQGGTGGNIAYTLALLGVRPHLVAAIGGDGREYVSRLNKIGVDTSGVKVFDDEKTALGTVMTDRDDNQIWAFYGGAMMRSSELQVTSNKSQDYLVVIAPNEPKAVMEYVRECIEMGVPFMFDPAFQIPHYSKSDLELAVGNAEIVIGNDYEVQLLNNQLDNYQLQDRQIWITTFGAKGSIIRKGKKEYKIKPVKVDDAIDPTGAGDAYRAGFLAGYLQGQALQAAGQMGSVAAAYTVEKYGTQTHSFTPDEFEKRYKENFSSTLLS